MLPGLEREEALIDSVIPVSSLMNGRPRTGMPSGPLTAATPIVLRARMRPSASTPTRWEPGKKEPTPNRAPLFSSKSNGWPPKSVTAPGVNGTAPLGVVPLTIRGKLIGPRLTVHKRYAPVAQHCSKWRASTGPLPNRPSAVLTGAPSGPYGEGAFNGSAAGFCAGAAIADPPRTPAPCGL